MLGFLTLLKREIFRVIRIWQQSLLSVCITNFLYLIVFSTFPAIENDPYVLFIVPGLVMMSVVNNTYMNSSFSVFSEKYHNGFHALLSTPLTDNAIILGFALGSVFRGLLTAFATLILSVFFVSFNSINYCSFFVIVLSTSFLFSMLGVVNGLLARSFDETGFIQSFILMPMTFLSGVFVPIKNFKGVFSVLADLNPLAVMCTVYRSSLLGLDVFYMHYVCYWLIVSSLCWIASLLLMKYRIRY